jgi:voltage-gated potassium channel
MEIDLGTDIASRLQAAAGERGIIPERMVRDAVEAYLSSGTLRTLTIELDNREAERLFNIAAKENITEEELVVTMVSKYPWAEITKSMSVELSEQEHDRVTAAAETSGMSTEQLVAEAIDAYPPSEKSPQDWQGWVLFGLLVSVPVLVMSLSPRIQNRSPSMLAWTMFAAAMIVCFLALGLLILAAVSIDNTMRFGIWFMACSVACGISAVLSTFSYLYWILTNMLDGFFATPMSRVDAIYFTLNTFATTGTGGLAPQSATAKLLVSLQVLIGFSLVGVILAIIVPRSVAAYKRFSLGRVIVSMGGRP